MTSENTTSQPTTPTPTPSSPSLSNEDPLVETNSLVSDAPLLAFIDKYPRGFSNRAEGQAFVKDLQALRLVPTTLRAKLSEESNQIAKRSPRPKRVAAPKMSADDIIASL